MQNVNEDFFGTNEDILVFYNKEAATPFTSIIPRVLENAFNDIEGVIAVSPEIFLPAIVNGEPIYARGVKYPELIALENAKILEGRIPKGPYEVLVGQKLSKRSGLSTGQTIELTSITTEEMIIFSIVGVYDTSVVTSDELLINLQIASSLSPGPKDSITHIRARFDKEIITEDEILNKALTTFDVQLSINSGDISSNDGLLNLHIYDFFNNVVYRNPVKETQNIQFLRGGYIFKIFLGTKLIDEQSFFIRDNSRITINIQDSKYSIHFEVEFFGQPLENVRYIIMQNESRITDGYTTENGSIDLTLQAGKYYITLSENKYLENYNFEVKSDLSRKLVFNITNTIEIVQIQDGSIIPENIFSLDLGELTDDFVFYIEDIKMGFQHDKNVNSQTFNHYFVLLSLNQGLHQLSLKRLGIFIWSIEIEIDTNYEFFPITSILSYGHYSPSESGSIIVQGLVDIESNLNHTQKENELLFTLPDATGFWEINIWGLDILGKKRSKTWEIIIEDNSNELGWAEMVPIPIVIPSDNLSIWLKNTDYILISTNFGKITNTADNQLLNLQIPSNSTGDLISGNLYDIEIEIDSRNTTLQVLILDSYARILKLNNGNEDFFFSEINVIANISTSDMVFTGANISISFNNNFLENFNNSYPDKFNIFKHSISSYIWHFELHTDENLNNVSLSVPFYFSNDTSANLIVSSVVTGTREVIQFETLSLSNEILPNIVSALDKIEENGKIILLDRLGNEISIKINKTDTSEIDFQAIWISENEIQLPSGNYSIISSFKNGSIGQSKVKYSIQIERFRIPDAYQVNFISSSLGFIVGPLEVSLKAGVYSEAGRILTITEVITPRLHLIRDLDNELYNITLQNVVRATYTISYENGTSISSDYAGMISIEETVSPLGANIIFNLTDNFNFQSTLSHSFILGKNLINGQITFYNNSLSGIADLNVTLRGEETNEIWEFIATKDNSTVNITTVSQRMAYTIYDAKNSIFIANGVFIFDDNIEIKFGDYQIRFNIYDQNNGLYSNNTLLVIENIGTGIISAITYTNNPIFLKAGIYNFTYSDFPFESYRIIEINESSTIDLWFPVYFVNLEIQILNVPLLPSSLIISHDIIDYQRLYDISIDNQIIEIILPIGNITILLSGIWGTEEISLNIQSTQNKIILILQSGVELIDSPPYDLKINDLLDKINIAFVTSGDYLESYFQGALIIIQTILLTQILVILIVLLYNINEISSNLTQESKKEIKLIVSIGASKRQAIFSYTKKIFFATLFIAILGQVIASLLVKLLIISNNTIFFGHQFNPSVFTISIFTINFLVTFVTLIFGSFSSFKEEILV